VARRRCVERKSAAGRRADLTDARGLIKQMLQHEPSQRPSIEAILTHPWFKSTLIDQLPTADHPEGHSVPASPHLGASSPRPVPVRLPSSPLSPHKCPSSATRVRTLGNVV
jgi:serine/threonine protein kinase